MKNRILFLFLVLSAAVFLLDRQGFLKPLRTGAQRLIVPVQYTVFFSGRMLFSPLRVFTFWRSGEERIKNLEQRNLALSAEAAKVPGLLRENEALKKQFGSSSSQKYNLLPANLIGKTDYWQIDRGEKDGVKVGQAVVSGEVLVGIIKRTTGMTAYLMRPFDSHAKIPVKVGTTRGVVIGQYNNAMILDKVAQNENINVGDFVLTSGEGGRVASDLIVGRIKTISSKESDLFKTAELEGIIDDRTLETVFVVLTNE